MSAGLRELSKVLQALHEQLARTAADGGSIPVISDPLRYRSLGGLGGLGGPAEPPTRGDLGRLGLGATALATSTSRRPLLLASLEYGTATPSVLAAQTPERTPSELPGPPEDVLALVEPGRRRLVLP